MNQLITDLLQGGFPETIEEYMQQGVARCIAFNRRGTLLAAGCTDGTCVIWDFETRGVAKELHDKDHSATITSICWSKCGRQILTSATDKFLTIWDVAEGRTVARVALQQTALYARLHPGSRNPSLGLACPLSSPPILVDFNSSNQYVLPVSAHASGTEQVPHPRSKSSDIQPAAASFNKRGDLIYVGNSKGEILIIDIETRKVQAIFQVPGNALIKQLVFSKCGKYLLANSGDYTIRVFENCLPRDKAACALEELVNASGDSPVTENIKLVGSQCLKLLKEFQDAVHRLPWKTACFSGDSEWVIGAIAGKLKREHKICIWDRSGQLVKILDGPKEGLIDLSWHPIWPLVVSVAMSGNIYIWAKEYTEDWNTMFPDYKDVEKNEEYVEREDEFDMMPYEKVKNAQVDEDEEVDIMTTENLDVDSDDSGEGLYYLPTIPLPDSPKQQEQSSASPFKPENSTTSQSDRPPALEEGKANKTPEHRADQTPDSP